MSLKRPWNESVKDYEYAWQKNRDWISHYTVIGLIMVASSTLILEGREMVRNQKLQSKAKATSIYTETNQEKSNIAHHCLP